MQQGHNKQQGVNHSGGVVQVGGVWRSFCLLCSSMLPVACLLLARLGCLFKSKPICQHPVSRAGQAFGRIMSRCVKVHFPSLPFSLSLSLSPRRPWSLSPLCYFGRWILYLLFRDFAIRIGKYMYLCCTLILRTNNIHSAGNVNAPGIHEVK